MAALPYSEAGRNDSEAAYYADANRLTLSSIENAEMPLLNILRAQASTARKLKYETIMLKVSGEALQVSDLM
jgi:hypothetical protein